MERRCGLYYLLLFTIIIYYLLLFIYLLLLFIIIVQNSAMLECPKLAEGLSIQSLVADGMSAKTLQF